MKKKMVVSLLFILFCLLPIRISALEMDSYVNWELDRSIFVHQLRNGEDHITNLAMIKANGVTAYCIEPGVLADKDSMYNSTSDVSQTPLGNIDTKYVSLVGYYGYGYPGHSAKEYYMAAQELIWRHMGVDDVWFSDAKTGGNIINVNKEKEEILSLVNNYEVAPQLNFRDKYIVGDEVNINDNNGVLNDYLVLESNTDVVINGNELTINVKQGKNEFTLSRKSNPDGIRFYYKSGYQTIASFEGTYDYCANYSLPGVYGEIIVDKFDFDTKSKVPSSSFASLKGATYTIYDKNDKEIASKVTDESGRVIFGNLPKGNYSIKETSPSMGYTLNQEINRTFLGSTQLSITLNSDEKVIKNKIIINKVLDDDENNLCVPEAGIEFGVYDMNNVLIGIYFTDQAGNIELELPYGKYILKQLSAPEGIDKVEDVEIIVGKDGKEQHFSLVNKRIPEKKNEIQERVPLLPNTGKQDYIIITLLFNITSLVGIVYGKKFL